MPYSIAREPGGHSIRYVVTGFWDLATVQRFCRQFDEEVARATVGGRRPTVLSDARGFNVQSREVAEAFERHMLTVTLPKIARMAILVSTALNKLQVERGSAPAGNTRVFMDEEEALAWLAEAHSRAAA